MKGQQRIDEFALVLLAAIILIAILMIVWTTPTEGSPLVSPTSISLSVVNGTNSTFQLLINNTITNVTLSAQGAIAPWVTFSQNNFDVLNSTSVTVTVSPPNSTNPGIYQGSIIVTSTGGQSTVSMSVTVSNATQLSSKSTQLGSFTISYTNGTQVVSSSGNAIVSQGYFSSKPLKLTGSVSPTNLQLAQSADLQIDVSNTNSFGNLVVYLNGIKIFDSQTGTGLVDIPVPIADLQQYNTLQIQAGSPGFYFWANTIYEIQDAKLTYSYNGIFSKQFQFSLTPNEISNFDHFQLVWLVQDYSVPIQPLEISINGQVIYDAKPPLAALNQNFNQDIFSLPINLQQNNTIGFSFNTPGSLSVTSASLNVFYRSSSQQ